MEIIGLMLIGLGTFIAIAMPGGFFPGLVISGLGGVVLASSN